MTALLAVFATLLIAPHSQAAVVGDDYPSNLKKYAKDAVVDPWRFYNRECTSFVAWRITNTLGFSQFNDFWLAHWGNASEWKAAAQTSAVKNAGVTVDNTPTVGAVAWWSAHSVGSSVGHVAYVATVSSSSITIEEYNYLHSGFYDTRTIPRGSGYWPGAFIHFPSATLTNSAPPAISGTLQVGNRIAASAGTWSIPGVSLAYQWLDNGTPIDRAVRSTFLVGPSRAGHRLSVRVTATKSGYKPVAVTSSQTGVIAPGVYTASAPPAISGTPKVALPLNASKPTVSGPAAYSYQWSADGTPIPGATGTTFTPGAAQAGAAITVAVTASHHGYVSKTIASSPTPQVQNGTFANSVAPSISGTPKVGTSVTASPGSWSPSAAYAYQWSANGTPIAGATGVSYTPTPQQAGAALSVAVTASTQGYDPATLSTPAQTIAKGSFAATRAPALSGTPQVGVRVSVDPGTWSPSPATVHYRWQVGGVVVGTDAPSYTPTAADDGKSLRVRVIVGSAGYDPGVVTTPAAPVAAGTNRLLAAPTVSGIARMGERLTATPARWSVTPSRVRYQWYSGATAIPKATAPTLVLGSAQVGRPGTVVETAVAPGYTTAKATSAATVPVTYGVAGLGDHPTITGSRVYGHTLTAHVTGVTPAKATVSYQWYLRRTPIAGATSASYTLGAADVGHQVWVRATVSAPSWTTGTSSSQNTTITRTTSALSATSTFSGARHHVVTLHLLMAAPGAEHPHGIVAVSEHGHALGSVDLRHARGSVDLGALAPGRHRLTLRYAGTPVIEASTATVDVLVR